MKQLSIHFTSNVINSEGKRDICNMVSDLLLQTLTARTYFWSIIKDKPYNDDYAQTDGRQFFQCGLVCAMKEEFEEALQWYTLGSKCFTDSSVLYNDLIQLDYDFTDYKYDIRVNTWINTPFGSKQELYNVAEIHCWDPHLSDMTGEDVVNRVNELRDEWFELVAKERKCIADTKAALAELDAQRLKGGK